MAEFEQAAGVVILFVFLLRSRKFSLGHQTFTSSRPPNETLENGVKYAQS